ncbi:hypothetical protein [Pseudomonas sp. LB3P38]|uniref:hypothetical protein n=1 Tax=Pseudomonas lyxosi TaxID=3398358 RepID=UPI0039EF83C2
MNTIENTDYTISDLSDDLLSYFNSTSIGVLFQLSPYLFSEENRAMLEDMVGKAKVELADLMENAKAEREMNQAIERWKNQKKDPKTTRVIVKIINNTPHEFEMAQTSLPLDKSERESFYIPPQGQTAFKADFNYNYAYPWPKNKIMFNQFIDFIDQNVGVRFDLGLIMNTSFGLLTPTLKPRVKNSINSIGSSKINCSTKITNMSDEAPFNFEVEITLG